VGTDPWRLPTGGRCYLANPGPLLGGYNRLGGQSRRATAPVSGRFWSFFQLFVKTRSKKECVYSHSQRLRMSIRPTIVLH
jgi:hypothetical protein